MFEFDSPKDQSSYIKVIGVGGGGGNAVNHMYNEGINGVDFIVCNTDAKALNSSPVPNKIALGTLGAGCKPEVAKKAAEAHADEIRESLSHNTQMLFITAGMGGGTGTGAAPVIADIAKSIELDDEEVKKILVVAVVTMPFSFEGRRKREQAENGIEQLRKNVDSILIINNDKLRSMGDLRMNEAFAKADDVLLTAVKGIAEIITNEGYVNVDFRDVNTVMSGSGTALMGTGIGKGTDRAMQAIQAASTSVLLNDNNIEGAKNVLLYFSASSEHQITMDEFNTISDHVTELTNNAETEIIWGTGTDDTLDDELKITLVATGFEKNSNKNGSVHVLEEGNTFRTPKPAPVETPSPAPQNMEPELTPDSPSYKEPAAQAEPQQPQRRVFVLDEEPVDEPQSAAPVPTQDEMMNDGIVMVSAAEAKTEQPMQQIRPAQPVQQPVAEPVTEPIQQAPVQQPVQQPVPRVTMQPQSDAQVLSASERIKRIHDLLRNNPNGPQIVEDMVPSQVTDEVYSTRTETSRSSVNPDGTLKRNNYLWDQAD